MARTKAARPARLRIALALAGCFALSGCVGELGPTPAGPSGPGGPGTIPPRTTRCEAPPPALAMPLQRLSIDEYRASLRAVVGDEALAAIGGDPFLTIPPDSAQEEGEFSRADQRLSSGHVDGFFAVADTLAQTISGDASLRASVAGECARATPDEACLRAFAQRLIALAYRRPAQPAEVDSLLASSRDVGGGAAACTRSSS